MLEIPLYGYLIAVSFLVSLVFYQRNRDLDYLRWFPMFLFVSLSVEAYAIYVWYIGGNTVRMYNFFSFFEFIFYLFIFYKIIRTPKAKKVIVIAGVAFAVTDLINIFFLQGIDRFHTVTYSLGCLLIIAFSIFYFFELFRLPKFISLTREPAFWIVSGLLFFYCCSFPYFALSGLLEGVAPFIMNNFDKIISILNTLLYSLFTIAFICRIKVRSSI